VFEAEDVKQLSNGFQFGYSLNLEETRQVCFLTQVLTQNMTLGAGEWVASPPLELKKKTGALPLPLKVDYGENH
jgi:hypothetical protein